MTPQIAKDIATLKPRILRAAGEISGVLRPVQSYYTPHERMQEYMHIYGLRVGEGHDPDLDCVVRLYSEFISDEPDGELLEALGEAVEAAIEAAEPQHTECPEEP